MKKLLLSIGSLALIAIVFYACKKDQIETPIPVSSEGFTVKNGRLAFNSVESYETFIEEFESPTTNSNAKFSYGNKKGSSDTLIEDDFLASILNEKNIIQIGGNAYKLDFSEDKVYVLRNANDDNISILENKDLSKLIVYSMEDDVLELEEEAIMQFSLKKCGEKKARRCKDQQTLNTEVTLSTTVNSDGSITIKSLKTNFLGKVVYQKAGIYFSIQSKLSYTSKEITTTYFANNDSTSTTAKVSKYPFWASADANGTFKPKCVVERTFSVFLPERCRSDIKIDSGTDKSKRIYRGTSGLSKYCISVTYRFNSNVTNCVGPVNSVMELKIGDGYSGCDVCPNRDN